MTKGQQQLIEDMHKAEVTFIDADNRGVAHLNGKTVNGNMIHSMIGTGLLAIGNQPESTLWRYTLTEVRK